MKVDLKVQYYLLFLCGGCLRYMLIRNTHIRKLMEGRVEIGTPVSSWKRAIEGAYLAVNGVDPYEGDVFHESPLMLMVYSNIYLLGEEYYPVVFTLCDTTTAAVLALAAYCYLKGIITNESKTKKFSENVSVILLTPDTVRFDPFYVAAMYLFGPFTLASCVGCSTSVFLNLLLSFFILMASQDKLAEAGMLLGIISFNSFHHLALFAPLVLYGYKRYDIPNSRAEPLRLFTVVFSFVFMVWFLLYWSFVYTGSWSYLESTYGFLFSLRDLTPNFGVFWYFFTEMFDHFRVFFLWTFQLNAFVYTLPLTIRLRKQPMMLTFVLMVVIVIFKPYPCIGDVGFYISLLPMWGYLIRLMKQCFVIGCTYVICVFLGPVLWHLWIYNGSANANFYFGISLAFSAGQIFLFIDFMTGCIKREYYIENGIKVDGDGKIKRLRLN